MLSLCALLGVLQNFESILETSAIMVCDSFNGFVSMFIPELLGCEISSSDSPKC